jgi:hypothetical protein
MTLPRTPVPKDQPPKSSRKTSTCGGLASKPGVTRPPTLASEVEFSDDKSFEQTVAGIRTPSVTTETPKGSGSAERLVMSASTSPPASAVVAGFVGGGEGDATQSGTIQPNNDRHLGSGMSGKKSTATGTKSKRVSGPQTFDLDSSNSDLDIVPDVYFIPDPEFHKDMIIQPTSMLVPGAIQAVTQKLATTPTNHKYPFPTVSRYFIAKVRDLKVIGADLLRHRQLILDREPPFFCMTVTICRATEV